MSDLKIFAPKILLFLKIFEDNKWIQKNWEISNSWVSFEFLWQKQSQELNRVNPDWNIFSNNVELTPIIRNSRWKQNNLAKKLNNLAKNEIVHPLKAISVIY